MKIGFFSDTVLDSDIRISSKILKVIEENDFNVLNLEAPFINKKCKKIKKRINLYNHTNETAFLEKNKFKYVNLANNHIFDYGLCGYLHTRNVLNQRSIKIFGAGESYDDALRPVAFESHSKKIGIWGMSDKRSFSIEAIKDKYGVAPLRQKTFEHIKEKYNDFDIKVAYIHAGIEYEDFPEPYYREMYHYLIKNGYFDIIIGNHSHSVQGYEKINKGLIFYSLGNFIFPQKQYGDTKLSHYDISTVGFFLNITITDVVDFEIIPYKIEEDGTFIRRLNDKENEELDWNEKNSPFVYDFSRYRSFYKRNRNRKYVPLMKKNEYINTIIFAIFYVFER